MNGVVGNRHIQNVHFFYVTKEEVMVQVELLKQRFEGAKSVPGTRSHHSYIPSPDRTLVVKRISRDDSSFVAKLFTTPHTSQRDPQAHAETQAPEITILQCQPGQYIVCKYDGKWWIGNIMDISPRR